MKRLQIYPGGYLAWLASGLMLHLAAAAAMGAAVAATQPSTTRSADLSPTAPAAGGAADDLTGLSLEQLMQVPIETTNTLTKTARSLAPAAITTIDHAQIEQANARSLTDLLDIYVPSFESFPNEFEQTTIAERGIVGDRDNKFLVLVNNQEVNGRSHGFLPEIDQSLMGDFHDVEVVNGPGSATYGPGAIAGVISMQTYTGLDFQGTDMTARAGFLDEFYSYEFRHGQQLTPDSGWFFYGGFAQLTGANSVNSPIIQDSSFTAPNGLAARPGNPLPFNYNNDQEEYDKQPQIKLHAEYDDGGFTLWTRYTRGGESDYFTANRGFYTPPPGGFVTTVPGYSGYGYDQLTGFAGYKAELSQHLKLDTSFSYEVTNFQRLVDGFLNDDDQEQKATGRAILTWDMAPTNSLAAGVEYRSYLMGLPSWMGLPTDELGPNNTVFQNGTDSGYLPGSGAARPEAHNWTSYLGSVLAEDQWHINKQWTLFASGRMDKDRYTNYLFSPRESLAFQPTDQDTFKQIYSQSTRTTDEEDMRSQRETSGNLSKPETLTDFEFRYERKQSEDLFLAGSVYYNRLNAIDFNGAAESQIGTYKTAGIEGEASYRTQNDSITFSHAYSKLVGQHLSPLEFDNVTAALYGDGYDLSNYSNNVTKLTVHHDVDHHLSLDGNIQVLWDFTGDREDRKELNNPTAPDPNAAFAPTTVSLGTGPSSAFDSSIFLNLGAQYNLDSHSTVRVDAYNVLGWADQTLNKQESGNGAYRVAAPAFELSYKLSF